MRRRTRDFIKDGVQALHHLKESDSTRHSLWDEEVQKLQEFSKLEPADNLFKRIIKGWSE
jgi:hypothetical protein